MIVSQPSLADWVCEGNPALLVCYLCRCPSACVLKLQVKLVSFTILVLCVAIVPPCRTSLTRGRLCVTPRRSFLPSVIVEAWAGVCSASCGCAAHGLEKENFEDGKPAGTLR